MKKVNSIGKFLMMIGVLHLFRKNSEFYGIAGYVDNSTEILLISFIFILVGLLLQVVSKRNVILYFLDKFQKH